MLASEKRRKNEHHYNPSLSSPVRRYVYRHAHEDGGRCPRAGQCYCSCHWNLDGTLSGRQTCNNNYPFSRVLSYRLRSYIRLLFDRYALQFTERECVRMVHRSNFHSDQRLVWLCIDQGMLLLAMVVFFNKLLSVLSTLILKRIHDLFVLFWK